MYSSKYFYPHKVLSFFTPLYDIPNYKNIISNYLGFLNAAYIGKIQGYHNYVVLRENTTECQRVLEICECSKDPDDTQGIFTNTHTYIYTHISK